MPKRIAIILTAYNEEKNIGVLLSEINCDYDVIIVDDGSSDNTRAIALKHGCSVISHPINLGQGAAAITGYKLSIEEGYDIIIKMDADGQHNPAEISKFISMLDDENWDVIVGSRRLGSNYATAPFFRRTFLPFYTWAINKLTGYHLTDAMCGFRAFRVSSLSRVAYILDDMIEPQYTASEMFVRFAKAGLTVAEVPINMQQRASGSSYKGFVKYGWGVIRAVIKTFLDSNYRRC